MPETPHKNDVENRLKDLSPIMDEYSGWYGRVIRKAFYPSEGAASDKLSAPTSLSAWMSDSTATEFLEAATIENIRAVTSELHKAAEELVEYGITENGSPPFKYLDGLIELYDEFVAHIHRLEKDALLMGCGIDILTGMRSQDVMVSDLTRESARLARRGRPFCITLARIDDYEDLDKEKQGNRRKDIIVQSAEAIQRCIRAYDDAYRIENGEFVLCLKHTGIDGGLAAVERIRDALDQLNEKLQKSGNDGRAVSISFITAEPVANDDIVGLPAILGKELDRPDRDKGVSLQYYEESPLKRFVRDMD